MDTTTVVYWWGWLLTCIREMPGSDLRRNSDYPKVSMVSHSPQENAGIITQKCATTEVVFNLLLSLALHLRSRASSFCSYTSSIWLQGLLRLSNLVFPSLSWSSTASYSLIFTFHRLFFNSVFSHALWFSVFALYLLTLSFRVSWQPAVYYCF
jgi:hypothetical protein